MKYHIIGDIHGRGAWKLLIDNNAVNIFIGDYFDSYDDLPFEVLKNNFLEIINFKHEHPDNVILLYGNHDFHYMSRCNERYSRYSEKNAMEIWGLLTDNRDCFHGIAYNIGENYIVTHAGISQEWAKMYLPDTDKKPSVMSAAINQLWFDNPNNFSFNFNSLPGDFFGESSTHSPIWIRPKALISNNLYKHSSVKQIVGHTQSPKIEEVNGIIFTDCLGTCTDCAKIET